MAKRKSIEERLWAKVDRDGPIPKHRPDLGQCWLWTGRRNAWGYGALKFNRQQLAHRIMWLVTFGPIPAETPCVLHHCDNPLCVNPSHLWVGTNADNVADRVRKGRSAVLSGDLSGMHRNPERAARGERCHMSKLTAADIRVIRRLRQEGRFLREIAARFNIGISTVHHVVADRTWRHVE